MKNARQAAPRFEDTDASATAAHDYAEPAMASIAEFPTRKTDGVEVSPGAAHSTHEQERRPMWTWGLVLAAIVAGVIAWMVLRQPAAPAAAEGTTTQAPLELAAVDVVAVEPRVLTRMLPLSGTIAPFVQATVKSKVSGEIEQVTVREGQDIKAGDVIARIDTRNLQAEYDRELASVEKARADLQRN